MSPRRTALLAAAVAALPATALADPAGQTTLTETIRPAGGSGFEGLRAAAGEPYLVRRAPGARAGSRRARTRRSIAFFGQLTDSQIMDEMSPARVDFMDPAGGEIKDAWRPQEAFTTQVFDLTVRNLRANRVSRVRAGGRFARLGFTIATGDLADNQHRNETLWFKQVLTGGTVDPMSGKPISAANPCPGASGEEIARLNADAAARRYTGVADYSDYPADVPRERFAGFWDPDRPVPGDAGPSPYAAFPRYPGLMDRAQRPFAALGVGTRTYIARGNHDGLLEGELAASNDLVRSIATSCTDVFPGDAIDPRTFIGKELRDLFPLLRDPKFIERLLGDARRVPPDPERAVVGRKEYRTLIGAVSGFQHTDRAERTRSGGTATYYSFAPRRGLRFVSFDTVAEGGGGRGNVDDPQYRWLERTLARAQRRGELVVTFAHHPLASMTNRATDEAAGACEPYKPGCDEDPRRSTPLHLGRTGKKSLRALFLRYPNVVAFVAGHSHDNRVNLHSSGRRSFWEIVTASHMDWPQQARTIEIMDNRDGTLSLFGTILDHAAPIAPPAPGTPAAAFTEPQLGSISRLLALNDPQRPPRPASGETKAREGKRTDRNVELLIRDPR